MMKKKWVKYLFVALYEAGVLTAAFFITKYFVEHGG